MGGVPWLAGADPVFPEDLDAAEAAEHVRVEPGDILFVRTGFPKRRAELGPKPTAEGLSALQAACLPWLRDRDVAVSSDRAVRRNRCQDFGIVIMHEGGQICICR